MQIINLVIFLFILTAITIGISMSGGDKLVIDSSINNISETIGNITITDNIPINSSIEGIYIVVEKYIHFIGAFVSEITRAGINFGYNNPNYFDPLFIYKTIKLIVILIIISFLIKPLMYLVIILIMIGLWIKEKLEKRKKLKGEPNEK